MSNTNILMAAAGAVTTISAGNWIAKLDTATNLDTAYGIATDINGNVYVTGQANATTATASYVFIAKYNSAGTIQWQRKLDSVTSVADVSYGIAVDNYSNAYVIGQSNSTTSAYCFIAKYNSAGIVQWQRSLDTAVLFDAGYGIAVDSSSNIYITGQAGGTTGSYIFIAKYNASGVIQWQRKLDTLSVADIGYKIAVDSSGNVYITGQANTTTNGNCLIAKYDTDGSLQWQKSLSTATEDIGYAIAVDSSGNVYVTGAASGVLGSTTGFLFVVKYNTLGQYQWQTSLETASTADLGRGIAVDSTGNVYITGQVSNAVASSGAIIAKYNTNGNIEWQRKLDTNNVVDTGYGIAVDTTGSIYVTGQANTTTAAYIFTAKLPADGTIPGTGSYVVGGSTLTYSASTLTPASTTLTDADATLIPSVLSPEHWIASLDITSANDIGYALTKDSLGNIYVCGTSGASSYAILVKYNTTGTIQWQKTIAQMTTCNGIALDSSGNIYVIGVVSSETVILKLDSTGITSLWCGVLSDISKVTQNAIAIDSASNIYITGQVAATLTTSYVIVAKIDSTGAVIWQRSVDSASTDSGNGLALDSLGKVYITGQANGTTNSYAFIIKYDSSGTVQWQKYLNTGSSADTGFAITVSSTDNIYITGQVNFSTLTAASVIVAKYNSAGILQWKKSLDTTSTNDYGRGVVTDSSDNVYVTGQAGANYAFVVKITSAGSAVWKRKFIASTSTSIGYDIILDTTETNLYITGTTSGTTIAFLAKIPSDGTLVAGTSLMSYAEDTVLTITDSTIPDGDATLTLATSTLPITPLSDIWTQYFSKSGATYTAGMAVTVDSDENVYTIVCDQAGAGAVIKFDKYGVKQWDVAVTVAGTGLFNNRAAMIQTAGIACDSSNNIYCAFSGALIKLNSTGQLVWSIETNSVLYAVCVDSSYVYVAGLNIVAKINFSGVVQWKQTPSSSSGVFNAITVDSSGNVYATGAGIYVVKYNSSGTIQWRILVTHNTGQTGNEYGYGLALNSAETVLYLVGRLTISTTTQYGIWCSFNTSNGTTVSTGFKSSAIKSSVASIVTDPSSGKILASHDAYYSDSSNASSTAIGAIPWVSLTGCAGVVSGGEMIKGLAIKNGYLYRIGATGVAASCSAVLQKLLLTGFTGIVPYTTGTGSAVTTTTTAAISTQTASSSTSTVTTTLTTGGSVSSTTFTASATNATPATAAGTATSVTAIMGLLETAASLATGDATLTPSTITI